MPERDDAHLRGILGDLAAEIPEWLAVPVNEDTLRAAVEAVEENNRMNAARWNDWSGFQDVEDVYGVTLCDVGRVIVTRAIATDGASLGEDLPAVERTVWGQNFAGSFWNRSDARISETNRHEQ